MAPRRMLPPEPERSPAGPSAHSHVLTQRRPCRAAPTIGRVVHGAGIVHPRASPPDTAGRQRSPSHSGDTWEGSAIDRSLSSLRPRLHPRHGLGEARDLLHQRSLTERRDDRAVK